jgi:hypothetical protein
MPKLQDYEIEEQYKSMLDECYPVYSIGGMEYSASDILKECDPIAYRVGLSDYEGTQECAGCDEILTDCTCDDEEPANA